MYSMFFQRKQILSTSSRSRQTHQFIKLFQHISIIQKKKKEMKRKALQPYNSKNLWVNYDVKQTGNNSSVEIYIISSNPYPISMHAQLTNVVDFCFFNNGN